MSTINITEGQDFYFHPDDFEPTEYVDLIDLGSSGDQADHFIRVHEPEINPDIARAILNQYGAWDDEELSDDHINAMRIVWIIGCDLREMGECCLSTY